jgi:hypothetical protein
VGVRGRFRLASRKLASHVISFLASKGLDVASCAPRSRAALDVRDGALCTGPCWRWAS